MKATRRTNLDGRVEVMLEDLFYNKEFIQETEELRKKYGIPRRGYKEFNKYFNFLKNEKEEVDKNKFNLYARINGDMLLLALKNGVSPHYAYWLESFFALDYNYKGFEPRIPFDKQRDISICGLTCGLINPDLSKGYIKLAIFPGASIRSIKKFLDENSVAIKKALADQEHLVKIKDVRKVGDRDKARILELSDEKKINSAGIYLGGEPAPKCLDGIEADQIKKIITEERRKRKIRENR